MTALYYPVLTNGSSWRSQPLTEAKTLPAEVYFSPEFYRLEQTKIFGQYWYYVGHISQVASPGAYFTVEVAGQPLIILRDRTNQLRGFYNVCPHRAAPLVSGTGECYKFTCPYHAWSFDLCGNLQGAPEMELAIEFDPADHALKSVQVETWGPFIFVNQNSQAQPLATQLGELPARFQNYRLDQWARVHSVDYMLEANWKLHIENTAESYHEPSVHPAIAKLYAHVTAEARHYYYLQRAPLPLDEDSDRQANPDLYASGLSDEDMQQISVMSFYPNFAWILAPGYVATYLFDPQGPTRTRVRIDWLVPNTDAAKSPENLEPLIAFMDNLQQEDMRLLVEIQKRVTSMGYHQGRLCPKREMGVHLFQQLTMQAVYEG
jgi:phenylpropionate dioxygenase-like ring-hydroxylating dioxygenase large terminal subunit